MVPRFWYQDFGTKILVPRFWYQDLGTKILVPRSWYQDLGTKIHGEPERRSLSECEGARGAAGPPPGGLGAWKPPSKTNFMGIHWWALAAIHPWWGYWYSVLVDSIHITWFLSCLKIRMLSTSSCLLKQHRQIAGLGDKREYK